jgi:hypothetical protein
MKRRALVHADRHPGGYIRVSVAADPRIEVAGQQLPMQALVVLPFGLPRAVENEQAAARPWAGRHFRGEGEVRAELV